MMSIREFLAQDGMQYQIYLGMSLAVLGMTMLTGFTGSRSFGRYAGGLHPLFAALLVIGLGGALFPVLLSRSNFAICSREPLNGLYVAAVLAALSGIIMILADLKIKFPADTNVLFPASLLFYPAIGFFVEILFHVLPVTLLAAMLTAVPRGAVYETMLWSCIGIVALAEPVYQILWMGDRYPRWAIAYVGLHVFVINLLQLALFKRYDFIAMYAFRLVYYLFWHIGWGYVRLKVLFS